MSDAEKRKKWLSDPLMGKLVLVEPTDKRKHWYNLSLRLYLVMK